VEYDVERDDNSLSVQCHNANSFKVTIFELDGFTVSFDGWHEEFDGLDDALNCFVFGLIIGCRLKVKKRGSFDCSWTLQSKDDGTWQDDSTTGMIFVPFWRTSYLEYRSNTLIERD
tara:strand:- start:5210 stop:5557 length:348 start_codon:yes stop_codon:yes gene_type:complete